MAEGKTRQPPGKPERAAGERYRPGDERVWPACSVILARSARAPRLSKAATMLRGVLSRAYGR
jgi:hypothetical protein